MKAACLTILCLLCASQFYASAADQFLIKDGQPRAEIVIAEKPTRTQRLAAEELSALVQKISGAVLPIVSKPTGNLPVRILVGVSPYTEELSLKTDKLKYGAFVMKSGPDWLALIGRDDDFVPPELRARNHPDQERMMEEWRAKSGGDWGNPVGSGLHRDYNGRMKLWAFDNQGSLNAVYEFLRGLGARWYMSGELGEILPKLADIPLPEVDRTVHPAYPVRQIHQSMFSLRREDVLWRLRLGLHSGAELVSPRGGLAHEMRALMRSEKMKKEHPEYYAIWGGKRMTDPAKPCLSAEGLVEENVKFVRAVFDVYDTPMVSVMPQDGYGRPCQCELCEGKGTPERGWHGTMSDYVWGYVDRVAREVYKTHPDKKVSCFAYGTYLLPPEKIEKLSPNVVVGIVHGRGGYFRDPDTRARVHEIRRRWLELSSNKLIMWEHYPFTHRGTFWPAYFPHKIAQGLRELENVSMGEFVEIAWGPFNVRGHGLHTPGFSHLNVYVTARLYWDPDADVDALLDEYCRLFYGPAAQEMKAFIEYSEEHWRVLKHDVKKIEKTLELLKAAEAKADSESAYGKRIALVVRYLRPLGDLRDQLARGREGVPEARARSKTAEGLALDGQLDDPFWKDLNPCRLRELQTGRAAACPTTFKVAWTGKALVFGIRCDEIGMKTLNVQATEDGDDNLWLGDCVEILLETQSHSYYQLAISPAGALVDLDRKSGLNRRWSSGAEIATHKGDGYWSLEVRIPVVEGDLPDDPNHDVVGRRPTRDFPWFFNVCRQRVRDNGTELSAFSPTGKKHFHDVMKFARLVVR